MPRWVKLAGGWTLAAVAALAMSWAAVSQVRNRVIQPSVQIPPTVVAVESPADVPVSTTSTTRPAAIVVPEVEIDTTSSSVTVASTSTTTTVPRSQATAAPPSTTTTTAPPAATTTTTAPASETSSHQLVGGVVTIRHSPGVVTFVSAVPQPGFSAEPEETGPARVEVEFESEAHKSRFRAEWSNGELRITTNEDTED